MTVPARLPPTRPPRYLRMFAFALSVVVLAVLVCLFAVRVEALAVAEGVIVARDAVDLRSPRAGLILGRLPLPGDDLSAGDAIHTIGAESSQETRTVPASHGRWRVLRVAVEPGQAVQAGDVLATLAPVDISSGQLAGLRVRLDYAESHFGSVAIGQTVRLTSPMFPPRVHGHAEAVIERVEPAGEPGPDGRPRFRAWAAVTASPFPLLPGGSVRAETVLGRKPAWQVILEH